MKTAMSIVSFFLDGKWSFSLLSESGAPWIFFTTAVYLLLACCLKCVDRRVLLGLSIILALLCGHTEAIGDFLVLSAVLDICTAAGPKLLLTDLRIDGAASLIDPKLDRAFVMELEGRAKMVELKDGAFQKLLNRDIRSGKIFGPLEIL